MSRIITSFLILIIISFSLLQGCSDNHKKQDDATRLSQELDNR